MSELDSVFLALVLIYGVECAAWMQPQTVAFLRAFGARWHVTGPLCLFGPGQGGLVFGNPLPPLGTVFVSYPWPIVLSPHALARSETHAAPDTDPFAYETLTSIEAVSKHIHLNGMRFVSSNSASGARFFAEVIRHVSAIPGHQRQQLITSVLEEALDVEDIRARLAIFQRYARPLRLTGNALFLTVFVGLPLSMWQQIVRHTWVWLAASSLCLLIMTVIIYYRAHRTLYPHARADRTSQLTTMLMSPPLAIRAHDLLARPLFETKHPLAVAAVLCPAPVLRDMARQTLHDLRRTVTTGRRAEASIPDTPASWFNARLCEAVENFLHRIDLPPDTLFTAPPPQDASCQAYCPRCRCQYTIPEGVCPDCGNLPLVALQ